MIQGKTCKKFYAKLVKLFMQTMQIMGKLAKKWYGQRLKPLLQYIWTSWSPDGLTSHHWRSHKYPYSHLSQVLRSPFLKLFIVFVVSGLMRCWFWGVWLWFRIQEQSIRIVSKTFYTFMTTSYIFSSTVDFLRIRNFETPSACTNGTHCPKQDDVQQSITTGDVISSCSASLWKAARSFAANIVPFVAPR